MKFATKIAVFLFFLLFFLKNALFAGTWTGAVTIVPVLALPDGAVSASLENCSYTTDDTDLQQKILYGTATIAYSYAWSASPDGTILTGQGTPSVTASFDEASFSESDKDIGCWVTCDITYGGQVVETSNEPFFECLTVFGVMIKDDNGWDDPNPYIPKGGSRGYYAVPIPSLYGAHTFEWSVEDASPSGCVSPLEGSEQGFYPSGMSVGSATLKIVFTPAGASVSAEDTFEVQVWRLDLVINGMNEAIESDTGVFMPVGDRKSLSIQFENGYPPDAIVMLSCLQDGKMSLWQGSQPVAWSNASWPADSIPSLEIQGEALSTACRDISIDLTTFVDGGSDTVKATVFSVDVTLAGLSEEEEEDTGLYLALTDLAAVTVKPLPSDLPGTASLEWGDSVKLWENEAKDTELTQPASIATTQMPATYYVEGSDIGVSEITFTYISPTGTWAEDTAKVTVFRPNLVLDGQDETQEETGLYLRVGEIKSAYAGIEGDLLVGTNITLTWNNKLTLYDATTGDTQSSPLVYEYAGTSRGFTVKGAAVSDQCQDTGITMTTARGGSDTAKATVFEIDLDWDDSYGLSEAGEIETGLFIPLNSDNDDSDAWLDYDSSDTYVPGEDDTRHLIIRTPVPAQLPGTITLYKGTTHTKTWQNSTKEPEMVQTSFDLSQDLQSDYNIWVEGTSCSTYPCDVIYRIEYTPPGGTMAQSKVKATVYKPDLVISGVEEAVEEDTGAFINKDNIRTIYIDAAGFVPEETTFTLSCSSDQIALYDGAGTNTPLSFPYQYTYNSTNPLPKVLTIKGITTSNVCRDIEMTLSALNISDKAKLTVFSVDLDWDDSYGLSEAGEIDTGLFIPKNDDNDDSDTWLDCDPADTSVSGENDTRKLFIRKPVPSDLPWHVYFYKETTFTRTWENQTKEQEVSEEKEFDITQDLQNDYSLWVEGAAASFSARDAEFRIIYVAPDGETATDTILATIFRPDIVIGTLAEETEEDTGAFIEKGTTREVSISCEGAIPYDTTLTLSINNAKLSLYDGTGTETALSLPYEYIYDGTTSSLPKIFTVKGATESASVRDTTLTLTVLGAEDRAKTTIFSIDIDGDGLSETAEVETGLSVPLNDDDDNSDTVLDKDQNPVYGENDLRKLVLHPTTPSDLPGDITLAATFALHLWQNTSGDTEKTVEAPITYSISADLQSDYDIWAEGINTSGVMKDNNVTIYYTAPDDTTASDSVVVTVAGPNLTVANVAEADEENQGAYVRKDKTRSVTINVVGPITVGDKLTLTQEGSNHLSLFEGDGTDTPLSFPYEYEYDGSNLPKQLTVRGDSCSTSDKDATLKLVLENGDVDEVKVTVYDIDVDWHGDYQLSEAAEVETGLSVPLNDDDDNSDTVLDKDENPVYLENDLRKFVVRTPVPADLPGSITLTSTFTLGLWEETGEDTKKQTAAAAGYSISLDLQSDYNIWAEGINTSGAIRDSNINISYLALDGTTETDSIVATIAGPNLILSGVSEEVEEIPGGYVRLGKTRTISINAVGAYEYGTTFTLHQDVSGETKISLFEGAGTDTPLSFPYSYTYDASHPLPKELTIKGYVCSASDKDITLRLTDPNGDADRVKMTVYEIDLDWDGLSETAEVETGLFVPLNDDDDNADTTLDKDEYLVAGENDLRKLWIRKPLPFDLPGSVTIFPPETLTFWADTGVDTTMKQMLAATTYAISDSLQSDTCVWAEGTTNSNTVKDSVVTLFYTAPDGGTETDTVVATVVKLEITADPEVICAGGDDGNNLEICKSTITAKLTPAIEGQTITFTIVGNRAEDQDEGVTLYDVSTPDENGWLGDGTDTKIEVAVDDTGEAITTLRSSKYASNNISDRILFSVRVQGRFSTVDKTAWVGYNPPVYTLDPYLDPTTLQRLNQLTCGDSCLNTFTVEYGNTKLPNHEIQWSFKFWTMETLDVAATDSFADPGEYLFFEDLSGDQQAFIFKNTPADNVGINQFESSDYGYLEQEMNLTDAAGLNTCIYHVSILEGYVEIKAEDNSIRIGHTSAWEWFEPSLWAANKDQGYIINLRLMNKSKTVSNTTTYMRGREDQDTDCGISPYEEEELYGAEMRINANFDEDSQNKHVEDYLFPNIIPSDSDLLQGELIIKNKSGQKVNGEWWLEFPTAKIKIYMRGQDENLYNQITSGLKYVVSNKPSKYTIALRVEGIDGSTTTNDVKVKASFESSAVLDIATDLANITVVKTEFMVTFDDGPFPTETTEVLNAAKNIYVNNSPVRFAFFMVGFNGGSSCGSVQSYPSIVKAAHDANHGVFNHTDTHIFPFVGVVGPAVTMEVYKESMENCESRIAAALGTTPQKYLRPPYWGRRGIIIGDYNANIDTAAAVLGYKLIWGKGQLDDNDSSKIVDDSKDFLSKWNTRETPSRRSVPAILCYHEYEGTGCIAKSLRNVLDGIRNNGFVLKSFDLGKCKLGFSEWAAFYR